MLRGEPMAAALYPGALEMTLDAGAFDMTLLAAGAAIGADTGAREITTSPGGAAATGGGAFDATAAGDGDGDGAPSEPSECGCSPLT